MSTAEKWADFPSLAFDVESTGVNPHEDRIVTAALVEHHPGRRPTTHTWLVNPGIDIPAEATAIHGITTSHAHTHGRPSDQVLFEITGRIALWVGHGWPLAVYNAAYDLTMLEAENTRHQVDTLASRLDHGIRPVIDPLVLDKHADPYRKGGRRLGQVCSVYGVRHVGEHDAAGDALAAARLWPRIIAKHPGKFPGHSLVSLHSSQAGWRAQQMASLRAHFDRAGKPHDDCPGDWPTIPAPQPAGGGAR